MSRWYLWKWWNRFRLALMFVQTIYHTKRRLSALGKQRSSSKRGLQQHLQELQTTKWWVKMFWDYKCCQAGCMERWGIKKTPFDAVLRLLQTGLVTGFSVSVFFLIVKCTWYFLTIKMKYETVEGWAKYFLNGIACMKVIYLFISTKCLDMNSRLSLFFFRLTMCLEIQRLLSITAMTKSGLHSQWFTARNQFIFQGR